MNNDNLEARIKALEDWKSAREKQQITLPLDQQSVNVMQNYFMRITKEVITIGGASGNTFINYIGSQGNKEFIVSQNTNITYSVVAATNILTVAPNRVIQSFEDDMQVYVATSDTPPAPLAADTQYFVISSTGLSFKLSATQGGAEINITDTGIGTQYIYFF